MQYNLLSSFSVFGDFSEISIGDNDKNIRYTNLVNSFVNLNLIVSIAEEFGFVIDPRATTPPKPKKIMRPVIFSLNKEWNIAFGSDRIDINWTGLTAESFMGKEEFINKAKLFLDIIVKTYEIKFSRVAFNYESILYDLNEEVAQAVLNKVAATQLTLYNNKPLNEWRVQYTVREKPEAFDREINLVTTVSRQVRNFAWMKRVDCITLHYDCNTVVDVSSITPISEKTAVSFLNKYADLPEQVKEELFGK